MTRITGRAAILTAIALATTSALVIAAPRSPDPDPAGMEEISSTISHLPANCRRIAERRLKASLDRAEQPFLTTTELHRIADPLAGKDGAVCDEITGQSFLLGGT